MRTAIEALCIVTSCFLEHAEHYVEKCNFLQMSRAI